MAAKPAPPAPPHYAYAFQAFEACKELRGAPCVDAWHALVTMDPGHAAGVLLCLDADTLGRLTIEDWETIRPAIISAGERSTPPMLARWALAARGALFIALWGDLLAINPRHAAALLRDHADPGLETMGMDAIPPLLAHPNKDIRTATLLALGDPQMGRALAQNAPAVLRLLAIRKQGSGRARR